MKKFLFLVITAGLVLAACSKDAANQTSTDEKVSVSFIADLSDGSSTKAADDGDGDGIHADRCKLQIWWGKVLFYEQTVPVTDKAAKFENIVLLKDQTYDFLFWADNTAGGYYVTDTLTKVSIAGKYAGNEDRRDAFFGAVTGRTVNETFTENVQLRRPFAQLNVITTDIPTLYGQFPDQAQLAAVMPDSVGIKVTVPTVFNVKDSTASSPAELSYMAPIYTSPLKTASGDRNTLTMDYLLVSKEGDVAEVTFTAANKTSGLTNINNTFTNIPLCRNYRTNITGKLLTVVGEVTVEIVPLWDGEKDEPFED